MMILIIIETQLRAYTSIKYAKFIFLRKFYFVYILYVFYIAHIYIFIYMIYCLGQPLSNNLI